MFQETMSKVMEYGGHVPGPVWGIVAMIVMALIKFRKTAAHVAQVIDTRLALAQEILTSLVNEINSWEKDNKGNLVNKAKGLQISWTGDGYVQVLCLNTQTNAYEHATHLLPRKLKKAINKAASSLHASLTEKQGDNKAGQFLAALRTPEVIDLRTMPAQQQQAHHVRSTGFGIQG